MSADHPLRRQLHDELHARPSLYFDAPAVVWHAAFYGGGASAWLLNDLLDRDVDITRDGRSGIARTRTGKIKWEVHNEFVSLTHIVPWDGNEAAEPQPDAIWNELLRAAPGQRIVAIEVRICRPEDADVARFLSTSGDTVASRVGGGDADVFSTFRLEDDGSMRILIVNRGLNAYRTGRMVRRLLEIETYRMMALLSHPLSQEAFSNCMIFEKRLTDVMNELRSQARPDALLKKITILSTDILEFSARARVRFAATAAYADLVFARLVELREERIDGHQRIGVFIDRRFRPSVRSCEQADRRLENAAARVSDANELLRTSVQVELEQQNAAMLEAVAQRVALQTRLQEAVEGFSIIAISYYVLGILKVVLDGLGTEHGPAHGPKWVLLAAVPVVIASVWLIIRRVRSSIMT